jgi:hypothetical protein
MFQMKILPPIFKFKELAMQAGERSMHQPVPVCLEVYWYSRTNHILIKHLQNSAREHSVAPGDNILHNHHCENLKSNTKYNYCVH